MNSELPQSSAVQTGATDLTGCILSGGKSRRFGTDKARVEIEGRPLIQRIADQMNPQCRRLFSVADVAGKYDDLGLTTLTDERADCGPLAGLLTALHHTQETQGPGWVLLASCDLTSLHASWVETLQAQAQLPVEVVVFEGGEPEGETGGRRGFPEGRLLQPFPGLYHTQLADALVGAIESGVRSFQRLLGGLEGRVISLSRPADWPSVPQINTQKQLLHYLDQSS